jgi:plasmid stabilization system protein ParE
VRVWKLASYTAALEAILVHIARDRESIPTALDVIDRIDAAVDSLSAMPLRFPATDYDPTIRKMTVPGLPYIVFYRVAGEDVFIAEVFHTSRDVLR